MIMSGMTKEELKTIIENNTYQGNMALLKFTTWRKKMSNLSNQLPTQYQQFIHLSRYSRWLPDEGRRETWSETVGRYFNFFKEHLNEMHNFKLDDKTRTELRKEYWIHRVMPSMRCLMTAGEALKERISLDTIVLMLQ